MCKRDNHNERILKVMRQSLVGMGLALISVGVLTDLVGIGTAGFGIGPAQQAMILVGISLIAWSLIWGGPPSLKRQLYAGGLTVSLFLVWTFWLYPASGYKLNPFGQQGLAIKGLIGAHLTVLFLVLSPVIRIAWNVLCDPTWKMHSHTQKPSAAWTVGFFATLILLFIILYSCFLDRSPLGDEFSLSNPFYMLLNYGNLTYPAHSEFQTIVVHPPTHYFIIGLLMKLGFHQFHAAGLPLVALMALNFFWIWRGTFPASVKIGLISGLFMSAFLWNSFFTDLTDFSNTFFASIATIRPDLHLAFAWFTGLIGLESARQEHWNKYKLIAGGFLMAYANGIHYIGIGISGSLLIYGLVAWCETGKKQAIRVLTAMLVGACIFGIPFMVLWGLPNIERIIEMTNSTPFQGIGGPDAALQFYRNAYRMFQENIPLFKTLNPFTASFSFPLLNYIVPASLVGPLLLSFFSSTRILAIASLPHILTIIFYVRGGLKAYYSYKGYYVPEFIIYYAGIVILLFTILQWLASKIFRTSSQGIIISFLGGAIALGLTIDVLSNKYSFTRRLDDIEIARSCGREIIGSDALTALFSPDLWYRGGGSKLYYLSHDLIYSDDISSFNITDYFSRFDAIILDPHMSNVARNKQRKNLSSWYEDGTLKLQGFYFGDRRRSNHCSSTYLVLHPESPPHKIGFGYRHGKLFRFDEEPNGDDVFVCYVGEMGELTNEILDNLDFFTFYMLPPQDPTQPSKQAFFTFIISTTQYRQLKSTLLAHGKIREELRVQKQQIQLSRLLDKLHTTDKPIIFLWTLPENQDSILKHFPPSR